MTRTTASIFLSLLLVTTAGAMLPGLGGVPHIAEENTARADIGEPGTTHAAGTHALPPGIVARNTIEGDYIPVCGVIWDDLKEDVKAVINTMNAELKATPPGTTLPPGIMKHNAFKWFDRCPVDDIGLATKIGFVEITMDPIPCGHIDDGTLGCFEDAPPDPPGPLTPSRSRRRWC